MLNCNNGAVRRYVDDNDESKIATKKMHTQVKDIDREGASARECNR